jgi:glutamate-1-semialdehyde 2,1-aminomutase
MNGNWIFTELDRKIAGEIASFLPKRIFDGHAHIWRIADWEGPQQSVFTEGPAEVTVDVWREHVGRQVGEKRLNGGLFIGVPMCSVDSMNEFLVEQLGDRPESRGLICITPGFTKEKASVYTEKKSVAGFKPYHTFSTEVPTFQSSIAGYLPEWAWELADEYGLVIMLHLVKDRALADLGNQHEIREMCLLTSPVSARWSQITGGRMRIITICR